MLSRLDVPRLGAADPGTKAGPAPRFGIGDMNLYQPMVGTHVDDVLGLRHHGLVTLARGGQPVYDCQAGRLLGGLGVSGDEVDQDDTVAKGAVTGAGFCLQPKAPPDRLEQTGGEPGPCGRPDGHRDGTGARNHDLP
jgi:hypothetical protein